MIKILAAGAVYFTAITLLYGFKRITKRAETEIEMIRYSPKPPKGGGGVSEISLRQKRCDEKVDLGDDDFDTMSSAKTMSGAKTLSGATHTTLTTGADNLSLSKFSELDQFGYPRHDPRIDGSQKFGWYQPKKVYVGLDKHGVGVYKDPSIGSSGEIDRLSLGHSRSTPRNQPQWSQHTCSTESIVIPKSDDARYY